MKVNYTIKLITPLVYAVTVKDHYDRAMLFCRAQEFYESPSVKFRGKPFSIWDYMKWYDKTYKKGFSYAADWGGFNIPFSSLRECCIRSPYETPYDIMMRDIYQHIEKTNDKCEYAYVIGADNTSSELFQHELCHGLFSTDVNYNYRAKRLVRDINKEHYKVFRSNLMAMGYTDKVIVDEIQAYLMTMSTYDRFSLGVDKAVLKKYSNEFKKNLTPLMK